MIKLCVFCNHCQYETSVWYSEETGGDEAYFDCSKNYWHYSEFEDIQVSFKRAESCPDFTLPDEIARHLEGSQ